MVPWNYYYYYTPNYSLHFEILILKLIVTTSNKIYVDCKISMCLPILPNVYLL